MKALFQDCTVSGQTPHSFLLEKRIQFRYTAVEAGPVMTPVKQSYFRHSISSRRSMAFFRYSFGSGGFSIRAKTASAEADESSIVRSSSMIRSSASVRATGAKWFKYSSVSRST